MRAKLPAGQNYAGRRPGVAVLNFSLPAEAAQLIREYSQGSRIGEFIARLVFEHRTRLEERQKLEKTAKQPVG